MSSGQNSDTGKSSGSTEKSSDRQILIQIILKVSHYIPHGEIACRTGILPGSMVVLSADLTRLAMLSLRNEGNFDAGAFIKGFQDFLGPEGTLVIPSFNFNLRSKDHYSRSRTLPVTGALATETLKENGFLRTQHPLHSFLVWGRHAEDLARLENKSSFGEGSPFDFFHENQAVMLLVDVRLSEAFTFVHHVEEMEKVSYRKMKKIRIFLEDDEKYEDFQLFAKKPGWTMDMGGLETLLLEKSIAVVVYINNLPFTTADLHAAYPVIRNDILHNHSASIACFRPKLYFRDVVKTILAALGVYTLADKISHDPGVL